MPRLSDLALDKIETSFLPYDNAPEDQTVKMVFRPGALTPESGEAIQASIRGNDKPLLKFLEEALIEWDVEDDDGAAYPTTAKALAKLPNEFLMSIVSAMYRAQRPGEKKPDA